MCFILLRFECQFKKDIYILCYEKNIKVYNLTSSTTCKKGSERDDVYLQIFSSDRNF